MSPRPNCYLDRLFLDHRSRYFPGRLKGYSVGVDDELDHESGFCDSTLRLIAVNASLLNSPLDLRRTLVHEMCHVGIPNHGRAFREELLRVARLGEPAAVLELRECAAPHPLQLARTRRLKVHRDIPESGYRT